MSSKAFRVFNKRNRRVEENLHVEFLENKAIEKGAGPNWLFDIDSLTKSMNYVSVDEGINSTNFSGTKDPANQEVKKDVSSLRYIALPNWAHDTLLESSSSKPHDKSSTKVPEGSGNLNSTLVLLLPSESIRTIPRVRIGPVDTLIQTRNKSKEVEEQSFIATIYQKIDPALLQFCLFSCFLSQVEPKKVSDALQDPGWVEAMQEELLQFKIQKDPVFPAKVYKVEKAMYGLHLAPRAWYGTLSKYLLKNSFQRGTIDQTLFIRRQREDFILVQVYMDEIIFGSSNPQLCKEFEALMHKKFQMSAMGELNFFLGLQVLQKEDGIFLSHDKYIGDILKKFRYSDVRSSNTLMDKENPWRKDETGKDGHPKLGLWYPKASPFNLVAFSDSDYGGASQDRKSTTRGSHFLGRRLISWQCKKQTIVATSTTEAEYVAAASCYGQVLWIQNQLLDYG
nr:putative ribonuclease H-like domain-containing protein [Tanacetum cinerariifolium]